AAHRVGAAEASGLERLPPGLDRGRPAAHCTALAATGRRPARSNAINFYRRQASTHDLTPNAYPSNRRPSRRRFAPFRWLSERQVEVALSDAVDGVEDHVDGDAVLREG